MGILDFDKNYKPLYKEPLSRRFPKQTALSQQERDAELNNHGREVEDENFKQPDN